MDSDFYKRLALQEASILEWKTKEKIILTEKDLAIVSGRFI